MSESSQINQFSLGLDIHLSELNDKLTSTRRETRSSTFTHQVTLTSTHTSKHGDCAEPTPPPQAVSASSVTRGHSFSLPKSRLSVTTRTSTHLWTNTSSLALITGSPTSSISHHDITYESSGGFLPSGSSGFLPSGFLPSGSGACHNTQTKNGTWTFNDSGRIRGPTSKINHSLQHSWMPTSTAKFVSKPLTLTSKHHSIVADASTTSRGPQLSNKAGKVAIQGSEVWFKIITLFLVVFLMSCK